MESIIGKIVRIVRVWPYRQAIMTNKSVVHIADEEETKRIYKMLRDLGAGNHFCFKVQTEDGAYWYGFSSDNTLSWGYEIKVGSW